jgi:chromosome segregation ATPase
MANISRSVYQLEGELAQQEQLKGVAEKQQRKLDEQKVNIETDLTKQKQEKQEFENNISRLSRDIQQRQRIVNEKQQAMTDLESQVNCKGKESIAKQKKYDSYQQELNTVEAALITTRRQMIDIDTRNKKLERDVQQKNKNREIIEKRVHEKEAELQNSKQNLQQATKACNEKQNVCDRFKKIKNTLVNKHDQRRQVQNETDLQLEQAQKRLNIQRSNVKRCAVDLRQTEMNIKNPTYQQSTEPANQDTEQIEQYAQQLLNQQQALLNRGLFTVSYSSRKKPLFFISVTK